MIKTKLTVYNSKAILEGIFLIFVSVFLWIFAYHFTYGMTTTLTGLLFDRVPDYTSSLVASIVMLILAVEPIMWGAKSYGQHSFEDSWFNPEIDAVSTSSYVLRRDTKANSMWIYIISQLFMAAPRLLVKGVSTLFQVFIMTPTEVQQGRIVIDKLEQGDAWQAYSEFEHLELVIRKLLKLKLILIRERNDELYIRLNRELRA